MKGDYQNLCSNIKVILDSFDSSKLTFGCFPCSSGVRASFQTKVGGSNPPLLILNFTYFSRLYSLLFFVLFVFNFIFVISLPPVFVELDTYQTESGESYAVLRVNDLADDNAMLEFAVVGQQFDVLKLAFLGRMKG